MQNISAYKTQKPREKRDVNGPLRIIILGFMVRGPLGGYAWHHGQYVMGLARLGHDVYFIEDSGDYPSCYDPIRNVTDVDPTYGLEFVRQTFNRFELTDRWAYYDVHTDNWFGPCANNIIKICEGTDLLLNMSGKNPLRSWFMNIPVRVLVDTDPVFTQIRHLSNQKEREHAQKHSVFISFGENFYQPECDIPDDSLPWLTTRQPVVLDIWPATKGPINGNFTTIMQWDSYSTAQINGREFGMKSKSFLKFIDLPYQSNAKFELALGSSSAPRDKLKQKGWIISNPLDISRDPWVYQNFIQKSKAEFSVAKQAYVVSKSGWFSERSAVYLASGRPVITEDTGFGKHIPCGRGLFAVRDLDEAVVAIEEVKKNYEKHCRWARELAEEYFDSQKLLSELIERVMNNASSKVSKQGKPMGNSERNTNV